MSGNGNLIPQELITDILSRLPVKSLCRFKCVSPSWKTLISSPYFAKTHLHRTKTLKNPGNPNLLIMADNLYSVDLAATKPAATKLTLPTAKQQLEHQVHVLNSCNGLVLVSLRYDAELFLMNPSTRECKKLSVFPFALNSAYRFHDNLFGVGYDSSTDDYKVVCSARSSPSGASIMAVYSLRTDSWRRIQDVDFSLDACFRTVFVNGCLHGICWRDDRTHRIVSFDLSEEIMRELPTPPFYFASDIASYSLSVLGSCLCLVYNRATDFWKMEMYGVRESWKEFRVRTGSYKDRLLCLLGEDEFLLDTTPGGPITQLVVYNSRKDAVRNIVVSGMPPEFWFKGTYVESLISPYHGGGIGSQ